MGAICHDDTGPCMCGAIQKLGCTSSACINDDHIGDARPASHIPPKGKSKGKVSSAASSKVTELDFRQALTAVAAVYDKQTTATATAATSIVSDINARLSQFDWSLRPDAWFSKDTEQLPRESTSQVSTTIDWFNSTAGRRSCFEELMQYKPSCSIFPPPLQQESSCSPAQDITSVLVKCHPTVLTQSESSEYCRCRPLITIRLRQMHCRFQALKSDASRAAIPGLGS